MLSPRHQQMLASLTTAPDFDAAYVGAQVAAHQEAVALFSNYSSNGDNPPLVAFARRTLPTLERHLVEIQAVGGGSLRAM
jgi:putative membrane protein